MAIQEFRSNKLRTFLSLFGVTIGIFCIISVLSTVGSLEYAIQSDIKKLGSNTVYIDKWDYSGNAGSPWWKLMKRPEPKFQEAEMLRQKVPSAQTIAFLTDIRDRVEIGNRAVTGVVYYGATPEFTSIQEIEIAQGRYFQDSDYDRGSNGIIMGHEIAVKLFGSPEKALGETVELKNNKKAVVIGLMVKKGRGILESWDFDNSIILTRNFLRQLNPERYSSPKLIVQGYENIPMAMLLDELKGAMRSIRKLSPREEDDFTLNDINAFSSFTSNIFSNVNKGGWAIAALSLLVGMFGVANIMFVTVKERTNQIGLKKAIGAKNSVIMMEFLLESAFLCILGGFIGLLMVFLITLVISSMAGFRIFISMDVLLIAIITCLVVGVTAGIIPASLAAKMNPVVAIRSK